MKMKIPAFYIEVDKKRYGPFFDEDDNKIKRLLHLKGVKVRHTLIDKPLKIPAPRKKKVPQPSLLDGLNWQPRHRKER